MRTGIIGQVLDFSDYVSSYSDFMGKHLSTPDLSSIRSSCYTQILQGIEHEIRDAAEAAFLESVSDMVDFSGMSFDLSATHLVAGMCYVEAAGFLRIPFRHYPDFYKTTERCDAAARLDSFVLKDVSSDSLSPRALADAISKAGMALSWVDVGARTYELCLEAISSCPGSIELIPPFLMTPEIIRIAILGNPYLALDKVPKKLLSKELLLELITTTPEALLSIEDSLVDEDLLICAVIAMPSLLLRIPGAWITEKLLAALIKRHPSLIAIIPAEMITTAMIISAVTHNPELIQSIPKSAMTPEVVHALMQMKDGALYIQNYVPAAVVRKAVKMNLVERNLDDGSIRLPNSPTKRLNISIKIEI